MSAGVATLRSGDGADLMAAADEALYRAKGRRAQHDLHQRAPRGLNAAA